MEAFLQYEFFSTYFELESSSSTLDEKSKHYINEALQGWIRVDTLLKRHNDRLKASFSGINKWVAHIYAQMQKCPTARLSRGSGVSARYPGALDLWTQTPVSAGTVQLTLIYYGGENAKQLPICIFTSEERARALALAHVVMYFWHYTRALLVDAVRSIAPGDDPDAEYELFSSCSGAEEAWRIIADGAAGMPLSEWTQANCPVLYDCIHRLHDTLQMTLSWY